MKSSPHEGPGSFCTRPGCRLTTRPEGAAWAALWCVPCPESAVIHISQSGTIHIWNADLQEVFASRLGFHIATELEAPPAGPAGADGRERSVTLWVTSPRRRAKLEGLTVVEAKALQAAIAAITDPTKLIDVTPEQLEATPDTFHGQILSVSGVWNLAMEHSSFAGAYLATTELSGHASRRLASPRPIPIHARGLWLSEPPHRYGHMGVYPALFLPYDITYLSDPGETNA